MALVPLFFTVFVDLIGFGIIIPFLPFYAEHFQATPDQVTLLIATYALAQFVFAPLWGRLSDRIGRKPVLLVTLSGLSACYMWLGFADSLMMLFVVRAVAGAMAGNIAVAQAYVADVTPPEHRVRGIGRIGAAFGLGFFLGPALGGVLAGPDPGNPDIFVPAMAAAAMTAVAFIIAVFFLSEPDRAPAPDQGQAQAQAPRPPAMGRIAAMMAALGKPGLGMLLVMLFLLPFTFSGMESTLALWTEREFGWGALQNGYIYSFLGLVAVVTQGGLIGPLTRAIGADRILVLGPALVALGFAAAPLVHGQILVFGSFGLVVFGISLASPTINSLISLEAGPGQHGMYLGVAQSVASLARIFGPAWAGFCFVALGRDWPYFTGAMVMAVMLVLALRRLAAGPDRPSLSP
ncbi:MAG: MFS transporter [Alphaproteobacteria bacterium]